MTCGPFVPPERTGDASGSTAMHLNPGLRALMISPTPVIVSPAPGDENVGRAVRIAPDLFRGRAAMDVRIGGGSRGRARRVTRAAATRSRTSCSRLPRANGLRELEASARRWRGEALLAEKAKAVAQAELSRAAALARASAGRGFSWIRRSRWPDHAPPRARATPRIATKPRRARSRTLSRRASDHRDSRSGCAGPAIRADQGRESLTSPLQRVRGLATDIKACVVSGFPLARVVRSGATARQA